jgi:hypothetical protein
VSEIRLSSLEEGLIVGLLIGDGHFGGDGRKPQITLRMHVRHETLLRWLQQRLPRSRLYGPYHHAGRHYLQWMVRGEALIEDLLPVLERHIRPDLDGHAYARLTAMTERYADVIERAARRRAALERSAPDLGS